MFNRRELLERCVALGSLSLASASPLAAVVNAWEVAEQKRQPTPYSELGPFYKREAPDTANLRDANDPGFPLSISGAVYSVSGEVISDAKLEIWQADHFGNYDIDGYRFRSTLHPGTKGSYQIDSIMPGHYPTRVCQHVHFLVTAAGHKPLITQLYFATDPVFEGDPQKNFHRDPLISSVELVRPVIIKGDPKQMLAVVSFDLVMEKG